MISTPSKVIPSQTKAESSFEWPVFNIWSPGARVADWAIAPLASPHFDHVTAGHVSKFPDIILSDECLACWRRAARSALERFGSCILKIWHSGKDGGKWFSFCGEAFSRGLWRILSCSAQGGDLRKPPWNLPCWGLMGRVKQWGWGAVEIFVPDHSETNTVKTRYNDPRYSDILSNTIIVRIFGPNPWFLVVYRSKLA